MVAPNWMFRKKINKYVFLINDIENAIYSRKKIAMWSVFKKTKLK